ncbi:hypothetical protein ACN47E_004899 [Coniothyrium glycines]
MPPNADHNPPRRDRPSSHPRPPLDRDEETWLQFLRHGSETPPPPPHSSHPAAVPGNRVHSASSANYTLPNRPPPRTDSSSSRSSDRKRRLTTADSPMRRPSSIRMHSGSAGDTLSDPIMLDSSPATERPLPPPPPQPSRTHTASPSRRQSDIVLPPWQPDSDVSQCPVCGRQFTFLFRKHHCRKCGRVVCSSCSPHRITIPRQFIVHPPSDIPSDIIDLTGDEDNAMSVFGSFPNPALGGGEEVRVCNPCVPDPNFNPPPQYNTALAPRRTSRPTLPPYIPPPPPLHLRPRSTPGVHNAPQTVGHGQTPRARDPLSSRSNDNRRLSYHGGSSAAERWLPPLPGAASQHHQGSQQARHSPSSAHFPPGSISNAYPRSIFTQMPPALQPQHAQPPRPRRQIAEEDECPVCGNELPSKGPDNDESPRTQHIEECIALHSGSTPAPVPLTQQTSASLPIQRTRGMSNAGAGNGEGASSSNRMSHAARGLFPYIATEKDCTDDEGHEAECIICLEDFETGDRMARLVCWCKFHERCIKEWWEKKGRGACPTHQLQE